MDLLLSLIPALPQVLEPRFDLRRLGPGPFQGTGGLFGFEPYLGLSVPGLLHLPDSQVQGLPGLLHLGCEGFRLPDQPFGFRQGLVPAGHQGQVAGGRG